MPAVRSDSCRSRGEGGEEGKMPLLLSQGPAKQACSAKKSGRVCKESVLRICLVPKEETQGREREVMLLS